MINRLYYAQLEKSINQNLYSAPSRYLLRGAPDPGQAEKKSLEGGGIENRHRMEGALDSVLDVLVEQFECSTL